MKAFIYIASVLMFLALVGNAETTVLYTPAPPDPVLEPWRWQSFPELKGLGLQCLAQDREGNMWFGVDGAVRRYDGMEWTVYDSTHGLAGTQVNALCATQDGGMYAATEQGVNRFSNGSWNRVFPPRGTVGWHTWALTETSHGSVWAGTVRGAVHLKEGKTTLYAAAEDTAWVRAMIPGADLPIVIVPDEALPEWAWSPGIGIRTAFPATGESVIVSVAQGGPAEVAGLKIGDRVISINDQANGGRSVAVTLGSKGSLDTTTVTIDKQRFGVTYRYFWVYNICEGQDGSIWFGNYRGEIVHYSPEQGWEKFDRDNGLDQGYMPRLCQTGDGTIWAIYGDNSKSLNGYKDGTWKATEIPGLGFGQHYKSILESRDGTLWISGSRLIAYTNGDWRIYDPVDVPMPAHRSQMIEATDGSLWLAGEGQEAARLDLGTSNWVTYEGLWFQCETPDGAQWFIAEDGVVKFDGNNWVKYGVEDGVMDSPGRLIVTRDGVLWAAGSHNSTATTARFEDGQWVREVHPQLGWDIDSRAVFEAKDGSMWFSALVDWWHYRDRGFRGGLLQYNDQGWKHHVPAPSPLYAYGIGQGVDGSLWFGGQLFRFDGEVWKFVPELGGVGRDFVDAVYTAPSGNLWLGTRTYGVFRQEGGDWQRYDYRHGLADNAVASILESKEGSVWVGTPGGISRFDGQSWTTHALPTTLPRVEPPGSIRQSRDGAIWLNVGSNLPSWVRRAEPVPEGTETKPFAFKTIRYTPEAEPPETAITKSLDEVSQPGNLTLAWKGVDPWQRTRSEHLKYAWRMDDGDWSPYSEEKIRTFENLSPGKHNFQVRARDLDFNADPTPSWVQFTVLPPVWQQPWFIILIVAFVGVTGFQASRIVVRDRRLRQANEALSSANKDLYSVNVELKQTIDERARLDNQLQDLRYLYRLRSELDAEKSPGAVIQRAGETMMSVLNGTAGAGVAVGFDGRHWTFGEPSTNGVRSYERSISLSGKKRGSLELHCGIELTEGQERALLDETAGQLGRTLEARELEMQLLQSARLVSLGQMAAGVAHELNQPLTVIETTAGDICLRLMEGLPLETNELHEMMENVRGVVDRMAGTVAHLRVFSRDVSDDPRQAVDVNNVIQSSLTMIGTQLENHGIELTLDLADELPKVWGLPHPLEQVFLNLLANARDAVDDRADSKGLQTKQIRLRTRSENGLVVAEVVDNGAGMDEATRLRLFEPFFTTKDADRGTGLGLSIVYAIVRNHDGQIECDSEQGAGATFRVSLPVSEEENANA